MEGWALGTRKSGGKSRADPEADLLAEDRACIVQPEVAAVGRGAAQLASSKPLLSGEVGG